jgi:hypothetical protein
MEKFYLPQDSVEYFRQAFLAARKWRTSGGRSSTHTSKQFPEEAAEFESFYERQAPAKLGRRSSQMEAHR